MQSYLNAHDTLEARRQAAEGNGGEGPRTFVSGWRRRQGVAGFQELMSAAGRPLGCTHRRRLAGRLEGWRRCGQRGLRGGLLYFHGPFWGTAVTGCWGKCSPRPLPTATRPATHHTHPLPPTSPFTDALSCASLAGGGSHRLGEEHAVQDPAQLCSAVRLGACHGGSGHRWVGAFDEGGGWGGGLGGHVIPVYV